MYALLLTASSFALAADQRQTNSVGTVPCRIEPGEFVMGQGEAPPKSREEWNLRDSDEAPAHRVKMTKVFFLGATEVANSQFEQFDPEHKKYRGLQGVSRADDEPVTYVTWQ
jgi:formylglycine-generating enzyme